MFGPAPMRPEPLAGIGANITFGKIQNLPHAGFDIRFALSRNFKFKWRVDRNLKFRTLARHTHRDNRAASF